ncbi:sugar ABC transporter substrate-binding protein [Plantibacter sp. VKM Ac-2880]|uniref:ABC transporter substrate-binding protein n=1 Tax=Plantibacter sp. VKM Ac-2880 TaxID=2783827 RepID=UPI00188F2948|nr:sugar ABC transporter substrate-binding protein [Plantibacter sp. VKM Ac-2880]
MASSIRFGIATAGILALALTACSGPGGDDSADGPVTLEFWAWGSNIDKRVEVWNEANPDIQVNISAPASGADMPVRVLSAVRAGDGPDIAQAEYTQMPTYVSAGVLAPLDSAKAELEEAYSPTVLDTVSFDDTIYGVPQDLGPALFVYRNDLFAQYGLTPAASWDDFRALAEQVRTLDGDRYLFNFSSIDADQFMGLALQNGAEWWDYSDEEWSVDIASAQTQEVLDFWQGMVEDDLVSTYQTGSPEQIEATASGRVLGTIAGAWAPGPLLNQYPDTVGLWSAAQIPQWDTADPRVFARGGSANVILKESPHYEQALEFITWLNASEEGAEGLVEVNKFTGALHGQEIDRTPPDLMPEDTTYWPSATEAASKLVSVQWGPNTQVAFTAITDELGNAIEGTSPWADVLPKVQDIVQKDLAG